MKPLLHRRTFWKGVASGAAAMAVLIAGTVAAVSLAAPEELSLGKDCVVFDEPAWTPFEAPTWTPFDEPTWTPFEAPIRTVPEPSTLWLIGLAAVAMARNALFAAVMVVFVTMGRWLGLREEDD